MKKRITVYSSYVFNRNTVMNKKQKYVKKSNITTTETFNQYVRMAVQYKYNKSETFFPKLLQI